ncbi:MAG: hypothetical protein O3A81_04085 [bacterium]|nr:hypothetical protein [bacterium]
MLAQTESIAPNIMAKRHAEDEAKRIIREEPILLEDILREYRQCKTGEGVLVELGDRLEMRNYCSEKTCINMILLVVRELIPAQEREKIHRSKRSEISQLISGQVARIKMRTGSQIFDDERTNYLMDLDTTTPRTRNKFSTIASAMNTHFNVNIFTPAKCAKKVANVKRAKKK